LSRAAGERNRLAREESPYLRQHADNPVDWYPWGEEALGRAREENLPILLSIGYSACHWCHVMEHESFADPETARLMNEGFVNVKVDREERPDIDSLYMRAVQALTGQGGWPLTVFLTPDQEPFYGGTYFPPQAKHGLPSFRDLLRATRSAWEERPDEVLSAAGKVTDVLRRSISRSTPSAESNLAGLATRSAAEILGRHDPTFGGFGRAPKFPQPVVLDFLLEHSVLGSDPDARDAVLQTLRQMAAGGIRDHLGGGFHRYAVDQRWLVPHFEKMLYDNALLAGVYLRAFQVTHEREFAEVCRAILEDLMDDFRSPEGAFYTARDADSDGEEGIFYIWTPEEVDRLLGDKQGSLFRRCYDVTAEGNFEGSNILHLPHDLDAIARSEGLSREELDRQLAGARATLREARAERNPPLRDEKVLTGWNALAIRSFAEAGVVLHEPAWVDVAVAAAEAILESARSGGRLLHQRKGKGEPILAFLEDVAGLGNALLTLHEATLDSRWLHEAIALDEEVETRFRDGGTGLLYDTPDDGPTLILRPREITDSPLPSGYSLAAELRFRVGRLLGDDQRLDATTDFVRDELPSIEAMPIGFGRLLAVAGRLAHPGVEVLIAAGDDPDDTDLLLRTAHRPFLPGRVISGILGDAEPPVDSPLHSGRGPVDGRSAAWVCRDFSCRTPVTRAEELEEALTGKGLN
jgi:uncharacterized protein